MNLLGLTISHHDEPRCPNVAPFLLIFKPPLVKKFVFRKIRQMESGTDVLEIISPLLSDTNTDRFDKVSELKETFESQKKWY